MASASSLSTYLDVAQAASDPSPATKSERDVRAKVLVAVGPDWGPATALAGQTGLPLGEILQALGWLEQNQLVELHKHERGIDVRLSEWAKGELGPRQP